MVLNDWLEYMQAVCQSRQIERTAEPLPTLTANIYPKPILFDVYEGSLDIDELE